MQKIYIVRLTEPERETLEQVVKKLKGTSQKVRRAQSISSMLAANSASHFGGITQYSIFRLVMPFFLTYDVRFRN